MSNAVRTIFGSNASRIPPRGVDIARSGIREVEELFAPLSYEDRVRPNRNGKSSVRRGGGPGKSRLFVGNTWGEVLVIPHYDLPGRIIGFTFIGRDVNPYAGDIIYKRANIGQTNQRPKESGIAMLPAVQPGLHKPFGSTVFIFTDIVLAMWFHARWFRESYRPLPVVAVREKSNLKSLHLPTSLEDRRLIFCGPLQVTLPLARRHNGSVSEYTIPEADLRIEIVELRDPNDGSVIVTGKFLSTLLEEQYMDRLKSKMP